MLGNVYSLLLSPRGRIGRVSFCLGVFALSVFWALQHYVLYPALGNGMLNFYIAPVLFFLSLHIIYCVCGKRLHDLGRSNWALIGMFTLLFVAMIAIMLKFGGLEYFDTVMQNPNKKDDLAFTRAAADKYSQTLDANLPKSGFLISIIPIVFGLWLALTPGKKETNRYGVALHA